jgi:phosphoheptose isomerase
MTDIAAIFADHARVMAAAALSLPATVTRIAFELHDCFERGNKLLACGNGGSASDAEHFVAELVGRYQDERRGLPAITLVAGSATITALSSDYGYERVFARRRGTGQAGDVFLGISTSGKSTNIVAAACAHHWLSRHRLYRPQPAPRRIGDLTLVAPSSPRPGPEARPVHPRDLRISRRAGAREGRR